MSWVGYLLKDSELFILFSENSHILLKISVIPILLTFIYLVALYLLVNNQLNSSLRRIMVKLVLFSAKVSFFGLCSKMQIIPIKNLNIKTGREEKAYVVKMPVYLSLLIY